MYHEHKERSCSATQRLFMYCKHRLLTYCKHRPLMYCIYKDCLCTVNTQNAHVVHHTDCSSTAKTHCSSALSMLLQRGHIHALQVFIIIMYFKLTHKLMYCEHRQRLFIHCTHKDHSCSTKTIHVAQTKAIHVAQTKTVHVLQTNMTDTAGQSLWLRGLPCCNHHNESSWCGFDPRQGSVGDSSRCSKQVLEHRDISACLAFVCTAHNSHCKW